MKEQIHIYGEHRNLQGIASVPEKVNAKYPAVIVLNAGAVHKAGPFNLNVDIARYLSSQGCLVFRFDLGGMGDSGKIKDGTGYHESVMSDIKQSLSFMETEYGVGKFVIIGLCTGADHAHKIACEDERVVANVWLDGYGYSTTKFKLIRYLPVALNPKRLMIAIYNCCIKKKVIGGVRGVDAYIWELPDKEKYIHNMELLYKRNVKNLYIYSGGVANYYNYKEQFSDSFKGYEFLKSIEVEYYPKFDHTYVLLNDRKKMICRIADWINEVFN